MKIVFIIDSMGMGGSEKTAIILMKLIKKYTNLKLTCIILAENDYRISNKTYKLPNNIEIIYIYKKNYSSLQKLLLTPITIYKVYKKLKDKNIKTIFSFHDYSNLINVYLKNFLNNKVITSERRYSKVYFGEKNKYMKYFLKFVFNKSDIVVVNDIDIKISLQNDYNITSNIKILNNLLYIDDVNLKTINIKKEKDYITFITIGRLSDEKNTKDILYAFSKIKEYNYKLKIIGDGPNRNYLENLSKDLNIQNNVIFVGQTENVFEHLLNADIFVFSSLNEGFPNAVLEAMYAKLPIISYSFKAGINSILDGGKYGILVDLKNVNQLAEKMKLLAENKTLREKYSKLSELRIRSFMNENQYINKFLKILELNNE